MSVYRLPLGQYGYSRHVVNLPQEVPSFNRSLPRLPSELDIIVIRKEGSSSSHCGDFHVRRGVVLQWLLVNNRYYRALGVTIDPNSLAQLPLDGNVSHLVSVTETCSSEDNSSTAEIPAADNQHPTDEDDDHLPQSFIPLAAPINDRAGSSAAVSSAASFTGFNTDVALYWRCSTK